MEVATGLVARMFMPLLGAPRIAQVRRPHPPDLDELKPTIFPRL